MYSFNLKNLRFKLESHRMSRGREFEALIPADKQAQPCRYRMITKRSECGMPVKATGM